MLTKYPIYEKYHLVIQACANINVIYKEKKKEENLENNIINSKIKQDATYCVTKFSEINLLNDKEPTKPRYKREINFKALEKEKKTLERKIKEKNKMLKMEDKFNVLNTIDSSILGDKNRLVLNKNISKPKTYDIFNNNSKNLNENKTINILDEIDRKIKNKGKKINAKTKDVFIFKKE